LDVLGVFWEASFGVLDAYACFALHVFSAYVPFALIFITYFYFAFAILIYLLLPTTFYYFTLL
jgi:hypothetical protein